MKVLHSDASSRSWGRVAVPALLLSVCVGWILLPKHSAHSSESRSLGDLRVTTPSAAPALEARAERRSASGGASYLQPFDQLTGVPLQLERLALALAEERLELDPSEVRVPQRWLSEDLASWRFEVPTVGGMDEIAVRMSATRCANGRLELPYTAGLRGMVRERDSASPLPGARVVAYLLDPAKVQALRSRLGKPGTFSPEYLDSLTGLATVYEKFVGDVPTVETRSDRRGQFELLLPVSGQVIVHAWRGDKLGDTVWNLDARPGEWTTADFGLEPRPVVHGRVLDAGDEPVAGLEVQVGASTDYLAEGLSPLDSTLGFGLAAQSPSSGEAPVLAAWHTTTTDSEGWYRLMVPAARHYAASAAHAADYAFGKAEDVPALQGEVRIDLKLGGGEPMPALQVEFSDGTPVGGAEVGVCVCGDAPWFRQFPLLQTTVQGSLEFPWRDPELVYGLFVHHPEIRNFYFVKVSGRPGPIVVPAERRIVAGR